MSKQITIELKNNLSEIKRLSQLINEDRELKYLPQPIRFALNLSLEEILTNVISYGYHDNEAHKIYVRIHVNEREVSVEVEDDGKPFNPLEAESPNINKSVEDRPIGGLGIHLVRTFMDNLKYTRNWDKNILIMKKKSN